MTKQVLYCDICGKEVDKIEKYVLPIRLKQWIVDSHGNKLMSIYEPVDSYEKDVCEDCQNCIGDYIRFLMNKEIL